MNAITIKQTKPGYKKTPVGMIPEDWEVRKLDEVTIKTFSGTTPNRSNSEYYKDGQIPWIKSGELNNWNVIETEEKITKKALKNTSLRLVKPNTIIYALYGATAGIVSETKIKATINQAILAIYLKESYSKNFIKYQLYYNKDRFINKYTQGGQPNLNSKIVRNYDLIIPPLPEQKAIADCLSTWDKGIENLSALIASKKEQKKGLMQGIFNGKLKVENGKLVKIEDKENWLKGWKEVLLKTISTVTKGKQLNRSELNEADKYPSYSGGITPSGYTDKYNCDANTIIISEGGNSCGYVNFIDVDFWLGGHCYSVENNAKKMNKNFLYNILKYNEPKIMRLRVGSGLPNVQKGDLEKFKLKVPSLKEQTEIAEVFNAANKEIELLEQKLASFKMQKKGLMQVLLTGEKRLV